MNSLHHRSITFRSKIDYDKGRTLVLYVCLSNLVFVFVLFIMLSKIKTLILFAISFLGLVVSKDVQENCRQSDGDGVHLSIRTERELLQ